MTREHINSSNIKSVGYDSQVQALEVEFHSGDIYQYHGVPSNVYEGLMRASSHGSYFHQHIKGNYKSTQIS